MAKLYTVSRTKKRASWGSDHELHIAKFRLKLKKVGKTSRPFKYILNQIPYNYTVEMKKIQGIKSDKKSAWRLWTEVWNNAQGALIKTIPKKKKCKKAKWLSEEGLQIAEKTMEVKGKGEKKRHIHLNEEF